jgi:hypothetical protein
MKSKIAARAIASISQDIIELHKELECIPENPAFDYIRARKYQAIKNARKTIRDFTRRL